MSVCLPLKKKRNSRPRLLQKSFNVWGTYFPPYISFQYCCIYLINRTRHTCINSKFTMADLDDFFAKKDRKKSKVKKFATADELAKKMDDPKQKPDVRPKKERPVQEGDEPGRAGEEEEWKEYEEPVKDYTGLKIQVLQGGNGAPESGRDTASEDGSAPDSSKVKGPWNKPVEVEQPPPPPPVEEKPSTYVPPVPRQRAAEPLRRTQAKHAPDIHNDDSFPVLGAGGKRGGWSAPAPAHAGPHQHAQRTPLALGNRFTSLQDDS